MDIIIEMFPIALVLATPLIIAALGGFFSERSGVVNIALEGTMLVGAYVAAGTLYGLSNANVPGALYISVIAAIVCGILFSALLAFAAIHMKADQTIAGTALNILSGGLAIYICEIIYGSKSTPAFSFDATFSRVSIPILKDIPIIGPMLFTDNYPTIYIAVVLVFVTWFVAYKTPFGLKLRSCGEYPQASASMGINVVKMRWIGVLTSGAFAGLAGASIVLTTATYAYAGSIHGLGFISIATLIFGGYKPWGVLFAGLFFGFTQTLGLYSSSIEMFATWPSEFFTMFPYIATVIALILFSGRAVAPKASGQIYDAGKR